MSVESIVEAFARGLAQGFVQERTAPAPVRKGRRRPPKRSSDTAAVEQKPSPHQEAVQETLFDNPEHLAPPLTQAELEQMERALRGDGPANSYVPGEGVAPWQGS